MARIRRSHRRGRGSIPRTGGFFCVAVVMFKGSVGRISHKKTLDLIQLVTEVLLTSMSSIPRQKTKRAGRLYKAIVLKYNSIVNTVRLR